jgi:4-hydroxy-2-oxoheptanedioate aldolase
MKNKLKEKIERGERTVGTFFECGSTAVIESLGLTGLDYVVIDTEHGPFEAESVGEYVCAAERRGLTPLARVKDISRPAILKLLDVGAKGLIIPQVKTVDDVKEIVRYGKYMPIGERGVAGQRANGFGFDMGGGLEDWFRTSNAETMLIPQCETVECLNDIEAIASVEGVAGIFIGPYDLSTAMRISGQFMRPEFLSALRKIIDACHSCGKFVMIYCDNAVKANEYFAMGVDSAAVGLDIGIMVEGYRRIVADTIGGGEN